MTNPNKLPPDIEGIREMVADEILLKADPLPETYTICLEVAGNILSKLTEHGVVALVSGRKFGTNISTGNGYYEVVNLDGTPVKEG